MKSLQEFIKKETKRFRKWTKGAYEIKPEVQCGIPCLTGTRITKSSVENYFKSVLQEAGEVVREEEKQKVLQGIELWFATHDRLQKTFMTNDLIKFLYKEEKSEEI